MLNLLLFSFPCSAPSQPRNAASWPKGMDVRLLSLHCKTPSIKKEKERKKVKNKNKLKQLHVHFIQYAHFSTLSLSKQPHCSNQNNL
jgi:hypothetical protein